MRDLFYCPQYLLSGLCELLHSTTTQWYLQSGVTVQPSSFTAPGIYLLVWLGDLGYSPAGMIAYYVSLYSRVDFEVASSITRTTRLKL